MSAEHDVVASQDETARVSLAKGPRPAEPVPSMEQATKSGIAWASISRMSVLLAQFATTVVLARLLSPNEYGLVVIVGAFTAFALLFTDLGLGAAVIHSDTVDEDLLCSAFWLNAITGVVLTAALSAAAVPISRFYGYPSLAYLLILGSLTFTLSASTVNLALLERSMQFKRIAGVEFTAAFLGFGTAVSLAALGAGAQSVIWGVLVQAAATTVLMWRASGWLPTRFVSKSALRELWAYSSSLVGFNALIFWSRNLDDLLLGKSVSTASLALYNRAYVLMLLPVQQVTLAVGRVLFPSLARLRNDLDRLRTGYLRALEMLVGVVMPLSVGLSAAATAFIDVLYGSRWRGAATVLAVLAASGPAQVVSGTGGALYRALGLTASMLKRAVVNTTITVCAILIGLHWGGIGVAVALLIKFYLLAPMTLYGCWKPIGVTVWSVLYDLRGLVLCAILMAVAMVGFGWVLRSEPKLIVLIGQCAAGGLVYLGGIAIFARPFGRELLSMVLRRPIGAGRAATESATESAAEPA